MKTCFGMRFNVSGIYINIQYQENRKGEVYEKFKEKRENAIASGKIKKTGEITWTDEQKEIEFAITMSGSYSCNGERVVLKAYDGETWNEWEERMKEEGEIKSSQKQNNH